MGVYDMIRGAPVECDDQVKCWDDARLRSFGLGDAVPDINGRSTYSVLYNLGTEDHYFWVQRGHLTCTDTSAPLPDAPVYDKWGDAI